MLQEMSDRDVSLPSIKTVSDNIDLPVVVKQIEDLVLKTQFLLFDKLQNPDRREWFGDAAIIMDLTNGEKQKISFTDPRASPDYSIWR